MFCFLLWLKCATLEELLEVASVDAMWVARLITLLIK